MKASADYHSTGEVADRLGVQTWRVARLFELALLQEPPRVAGRRVIPTSLVPVIADLLMRRGWLDAPQEDGGEA